MSYQDKTIDTALGSVTVRRALPTPDGTAPAYDAVPRTWFDSPEAVQAALASPEGQAVYAHTPNIADVGRLALLVVQESTIVPG